MPIHEKLGIVVCIYRLMFSVASELKNEEFWVYEF